MSTGFENEVSDQLETSQRLSRLLERVAELQAEKDRIAAEATAVGKRLKDAEQMAVEELAASGLDGVRAAGKSWFTREFFSVSVPTENKEKVVAAAKAEGLTDLITVNTATLKAWLSERRKSANGEPTSLAAGTAFDGLVTEFREVRLSHRTVG